MTKRKRTGKDVVAAIFGGAKDAAKTEQRVVKPVEKAQPILTPKKPKVKKVRKVHVRPPKRTPPPATAPREGLKTVKARTLTHTVAKMIPKAGSAASDPTKPGL
jgi:hypothetical protein